MHSSLLLHVTEICKAFSKNTFEGNAPPLTVKRKVRCPTESENNSVPQKYQDKARGLIETY